MKVDQFIAAMQAHCVELKMTRAEGRRVFKSIMAKWSMQLERLGIENTLAAVRGLDKIFKERQGI